MKNVPVSTSFSIRKLRCAPAGIFRIFHTHFIGKGIVTTIMQFFTTLLVWLAVPALWSSSSYHVVQAEDGQAFCEAESLAAEQCFNSGCTATCEGFDQSPDQTSLTPEQMIDPDTVCPIIFTPFCVLYTCCPQCETEARTFAECIFVYFTTDRKSVV